MIPEDTEVWRAWNMRCMIGNKKSTRALYEALVDEPSLNSLVDCEACNQCWYVNVWH